MQECKHKGASQRNCIARCYTLKLKFSLVTDDGRSSRSLFIKNLDLGYLEDTGQQPMVYLKDLLYVFGSVTQLRLFNLLAAACVQFKSEDQAKLVSLPLSVCLSTLLWTHIKCAILSTSSHPPWYSVPPIGPQEGGLPASHSCFLRQLAIDLQAQSSLHDTHQLGNRRVSVRFLDLYPSDAILEARLGLQIWEMFRSSESDFSELSSAKSAQKEKEIRQLNAAAKEFVPKSYSSQPSFLSDGQEAESFLDDLAAAQEASLLPASHTERGPYLAGLDKQVDLE